ncbi:alpha/beta hydrolase [Actinoplanes sp. NBRC 14428]|nr:alpha/beta hydrolase [Actinoplanes sp. NBRC 14428]
MPLDPELAAALDALPRLPSNGKLLDFTDIPGFRAMMAAIPQPSATEFDDPRVEVDIVRARRDDGTLLDIVLHRPAGRPEPLPALLWFHAGAQVMGDAHYDVAYHAGLALALDCVLAAVDYRLAPETRAPGQAEDGFLAYEQLRTHAADHGLDPDRIGLAGASGGGAPAAAAMLLIRDRGLPAPCVLALSYPMLDDRHVAPSRTEAAADLGIGFDSEQMDLAWAAVLGDRVEDPGLSPYCAPGRATDLHDFPPTFVAVAQYDVLRDEGIDFGRRLIAAGVPTDLHVYAGAFHAWDRFAAGSALTRGFEQTWHGFLRRHLHAAAAYRP